MTERKLYGMTYEQWMAKAVEVRQKAWDEAMELELAFDKIKPEPHWKGPIDAVIDETDFNLCNQACAHFTGTQLWIEERRGNGKLRVRAIGYWAGPCG